MDGYGTETEMESEIYGKYTWLHIAHKKLTLDARVCFHPIPKMVI